MTDKEGSARPALEYGKSSSLSKREGYWPNLTVPQVQKMESLYEEACKLGIFPPVASDQVPRASLDDVSVEDGYLRCLRFLRARNFDTKKALKMLHEEHRWRCSNSEWLQYTDAHSVLQCEPNLIYKMFPTWFQGFCREGRPCMWKKFGAFDLRIFDVISVETMSKFHAWESDQLIKLGRIEGLKRGCNVETFVVIIDAEGWKLSLTTSNTLRFIKSMIALDNNFFPERLGSLFVINAPYVLSILWRTIAPWLDAVTKQKIKISSSPESWLPDLTDLLGEENIPAAYGGTGPDLNDRQALDSIQPFHTKLEGENSHSTVLTSTESCTSLYSQESVEVTWEGDIVRDSWTQTAETVTALCINSTSSTCHAREGDANNQWKWTMDASTQVSNTIQQRSSVKSFWWNR